MRKQILTVLSIILLGLVNTISINASSRVLNKAIRTSEIDGVLREYCREIGINPGTDGMQSLSAIEDVSKRIQIINDLEEAAKINPLLLHIEADLLADWEMFSYGEVVLEKIIESGTATPDHYLTLAVLQIYVSDDIVHGFETLERGLKVFPDSEPLLGLKAPLLNMTGNTVDALPIWEKLISMDRLNSDYYSGKARSLMIEKRYSEALTPFLLSLNLKESPQIRRDLMFSYFFLGNKEKTQENAKKLVEYPDALLVEKDLNPHMYHALGYAGLGDKKRALETLRGDMDLVGDPDLMVAAEVDILLGDNQSAMDKMGRYSLQPDKMDANALLYTPYVYPLHSYPKYKEMVENMGIPVAYNSIGLLRPTINEDSKSMGGTPKSELDKILSNPDQITESSIARINRLCPIDMGDSSQLISIQLNKNTKTFTYNYQVNPEHFDLEIYNNPELKKLYEEMRCLEILIASPGHGLDGWTFRQVYSYPGGSHKISFNTYNSLMAQKLSKQPVNQKRINSKKLEWLIKIIDASKRAQGNGKAELRGSNFEIIEYIDPEFQSINVVKMQRYTFVEYVKMDIKENIEGIYSIISDLGLNFRYIFRDNTTGEEVVIEFTPSEIQSILNER